MDTLGINGATLEDDQDHAPVQPDSNTARMENLENTMRTIQSQLQALLTQQPTIGTTHSFASAQTTTAATDTNITTTANENPPQPYVDNSWNQWNNTWWKT